MGVMTTNDGCRADVRKARAEAAEVEASLIVDDAAPVTGMSNADPTAAAVRAAQAEAWDEGYTAADFAFHQQRIPPCSVPTSNPYRADRLATDTAAPEGFVDGSDFIDSLTAPVAVEGVETVEDHHCATCQCAGTECQLNVWCKRVWGHGGSCNVIRDEAFQ